MATKKNYNGETMRTLTVGKLIELLEGEDAEALVLFSTDYGDYHHTPQALGLRGELEQVKIEKSGYSTSGFALVTEEDEAYEDDEDGQTYLLIK